MERLSNPRLNRNINTAGANESAGATRSAKLRQMLLSEQLEFLMEVEKNGNETTAKGKKSKLKGERGERRSCDHCWPEVWPSVERLRA